MSFDLREIKVEGDNGGTPDLTGKAIKRIVPWHYRDELFLYEWRTVVLYMHVYGFRMKQQHEKGAYWLQCERTEGVNADRKVERKVAQFLYMSGYLVESFSWNTVTEFSLSEAGKRKAEELLSNEDDRPFLEQFAADAADCPDTGVHALRIPITERFHVKVPPTEIYEDDGVRPVPPQGVKREAKSAIIGLTVTVQGKGGVWKYLLECDSAECADEVAKRLRIGAYGKEDIYSDTLMVRTPKTKEAYSRQCFYCMEDIPGPKPRKMPWRHVCKKAECKAADRRAKKAVLEKAAKEAI